MDIITHLFGSFWLTNVTGKFLFKEKEKCPGRQGLHFEAINQSTACIVEYSASQTEQLSKDGHAGYRQPRLTRSWTPFCFAIQLTTSTFVGRYYLLYYKYSVPVEPCFEMLDVVTRAYNPDTQPAWATWDPAINKQWLKNEEEWGKRKTERECILKTFYITGLCPFKLHFFSLKHSWVYIRCTGNCCFWFVWSVQPLLP